MNEKKEIATELFESDARANPVEERVEKAGNRYAVDGNPRQVDLCSFVVNKEIDINLGLSLDKDLKSKPDRYWCSSLLKKRLWCQKKKSHRPLWYLISLAITLSCQKRRCATEETM